MNKVDVHTQAAATGAPYRLGVSVAHGAVLPDEFDGLVVREFGATLQRPVVPHVDVDGLSATMSFNMTPFQCYLPWACVHAIASTQWQVSWALGESAEKPEASKPGLRLV